MTRKTELTSEDIERACERLRKLGENPTVNRVRGILGKGSMTTVHGLLREYLAKASPPEKEESSKIPPACLDYFKDALTVYGKRKDEQIFRLTEELKKKRGHVQDILKEGEQKEDDLRIANMALKGWEDKHKELNAVNKSILQENERLKTAREELIAERAKNETIAKQFKSFQKKILAVEMENKKLLVRATKAEKSKKS